MKSRKILSVLCSLAMIVSALPAASAAETEPLSAWAGKTQPVQIVEETKNGMTSRIIEVAIPEGATKAEEDALVYATALGRESGISPLSSNSTSSHRLSQESDLTIRWNSWDWVGGGAVPSNATVDEVAVDIVLDSFDRVGAELYLQVENAATGAVGSEKFLGTYDDQDDAFLWDSDPITWRIIYFANDGLPAFFAGNGVHVFANMNDGHIAHIATCTVFAYY